MLSGNFDEKRAELVGFRALEGAGGSSGRAVSFSWRVMLTFHQFTTAVRGTLLDGNGRHL